MSEEEALAHWRQHKDVQEKIEEARSAKVALKAAARPRKRAGAFRIDRPGWLLELRSNPKPRRMAAPAWLVCKHTARGTEPGLQAPWHHKMARGRTSAGGLSDRGGRADRPCNGNALAFHLEPFERAASLVHFIGHQVRFHHGVGRAPVGLRIVADNA